MIQMQTELEVADNSGAQIVECIKVLGGSRHMIAKLGDVIVVTVKKALPRGKGAKVTKGTVHRAVIVRTVKQVHRADGSAIAFDTNAVVIVDGKGEPIGTRIFGPVARELRSNGYLKIVSLAPEVL